ncbi:Response regulator receiver domain-containing protein [Sphingomonas guangdongensis]|uniref:Response regulator receiver domain-containing protein n=1 Tax=Sphingomonas guangdongensis TaxID=1141890 RepID=A0A285QC94_9SPHN|nr:response regulator [Sphingomonas guangdongensis]SOB79456.1 Response regulator receiver domain-containing protein [Sphingomonas guangdongensis]
MSLLKIIYIDDDADIRTIVGMSLSLDPSINVRIAASGQEGLDLLVGGYRPDVVILDVMMPGMSGPQVLDAMRSNPAHTGIPVIFMTAKGRAMDMEFYREQGAIGVILKPFDPLELARDVRALLAGNPPTKPV